MKIFYFFTWVILNGNCLVIYVYSSSQVFFSNARKALLKSFQLQVCSFVFNQLPLCYLIFGISVERRSGFKKRQDCFALSQSNWRFLEKINNDIVIQQWFSTFRYSRINSNVFRKTWHFVYPQEWFAYPQCSIAGMMEEISRVYNLL